MAPSAASSIKQSYSAGDCKLDLTLQPSALSRWYPKPIVEQLAFKLWMTNNRDAAPALVAEGDRAALQAITHHIEHRVQTTLATGSTDCDRQGTPELPNSARIPATLSYLQLCDLSAVLAQYQQNTKPLPVALNSAIATNPPVAVAKPLRPSARRQKGKLIPFPVGRRTAWASSAAAVLFAVGITATLLNQTSTSKSSSVANSDLAEPEIVGANPDRLRLNKSAESTGEIPLENRSANLSEDLSEDLSESGRTPALSNRSRISTVPNQSVQNRTIPNQTIPNQTVQRPPNSSASSQPASNSNNPSTTSTESSADSSSIPSAESATPSNSTEGNSARQNNSQTNSSSSLPAEVNTTAAPAPAERPASNNALDRKIANADSDTESSATQIETSSATADLPSLEPARPQARASREAIASIDSAALEEATVSPNLSQGAIVQQEAETITQVKNYFTNQWSDNENVSSSLSYQLQLSSAGEVVSFTALTEASSIYRDRLLPDKSILFPPDNSAAISDGLTLKVTVMPDGQVVVEKQ